LNLKVATQTPKVLKKGTNDSNEIKKEEIKDQCLKENFNFQMLASGDQKVTNDNEKLRKISFEQQENVDLDKVNRLQN
jgi:hypothetical protein